MNRRLTLLPSPEPSVQAREDYVPTIAQQRVREVGRWAAYVLIDWPAGVERHPSIDLRLLKELGRVCGVDNRVDEHLGVMYALQGEDIDAAEQDAEEVLLNALDWLGLERSAVRYCELVALPISSDNEV